MSIHWFVPYTIDNCLSPTWALWLVSNCKPPSRRNEYVEQIQKIIDVDIFGKCGENCTEKPFLCSENNFKHYRYYLSFENSLCFNYATEKFFKLFDPNMHVIPVVRGAFEYNKYIPEYTYINSADFPNPIQLALYLKRLGDNPLAYSRYLQQKDMYQRFVNPHKINLGCEACRFLHTKKLEKQIVDLKDWMVDGKCYSPNDL